MTSSFKPDHKGGPGPWAADDFRPSPWTSADEAYRKAASRAEQILQEAEQRAQSREQEGFEKGMEEGVNKGVTEGRQKLEPVVRALEEACQRLQQNRNEVLWQSEKTLVHLAVAIARCILRREVVANTEAIGEMVSHALKEVESNDILSLNIHPEDWDLLNELGMIGESSGLELPRGIQVVKDESVGRGGCVIRSDTGTIDGRLDEQLSAILARFEDEIERQRSHSKE